MIAMSPTVTLKGNIKFSLKKALVGGEMSKSTYTGPGELLLAPSAIGDITIIKLSGHEQWSVGKDAFLACTQGVVTEYKSQGLGKAMFSGEGLFVYKISGQGIIWVTSFGAIIRKDVSTTISAVVKCERLTWIAASKRREVHHRQWPSGGLELQVRPRARIKRRYHLELGGWRRVGVQVYWSWNCLYADSQPTSLLAMASSQCSSSGYLRSTPAITLRSSDCSKPVDYHRVVLALLNAFY